MSYLCECPFRTMNLRRMYGQHVKIWGAALLYIFAESKLNSVVSNMQLKRGG